MLAWYACAWIGAVAVTTNARAAGDELAYYAGHCGAVGGITQPKFAELVAASCKGLRWLSVTATDNGAAPVHVPDLASRAAGYGLPGQVVDGNDVLAVQTAVGEACRRARCGEGATLIECKTYRILGHSRGDPRRYRTVEEEAEWRAKDPILRFRAWLMQQTRLTPAQDRQIRRAAKDIVRQAVRFARTSPWPDAATLEAGVFA